MLLADKSSAIGRRLHSYWLMIAMQSVCSNEFFNYYLNSCLNVKIKIMQHHNNAIACHFNTKRNYKQPFI